MTMTTIAPITASTTASQTMAATGNKALGQQDFLTLLTAQLKNQDPLKPMDNAEFLGQMAQFSTVSGIDRINETLSGFGSGMRDMRISMASNMLGHSVLVPGSVAYPDDTGAVRGAVDLPGSVQSLVVSYSDARNGTLLHTQTLGAQPAGMVGFEWADLPASITAARGPVRVSLSAAQDGATVNLDPQVYARVLSASAGGGADDVTLQVEGFGAINTLEIESFR
jgi:flagellar basal-body rod modification protein FlgD